MVHVVFPFSLKKRDVKNADLNPHFFQSDMRKYGKNRVSTFTKFTTTHKDLCSSRFKG